MPSLRVIDGSDISGDKNTKRSRSHKINNKQTHFNHSVYLNDAAAAVARGFKHSQKPPRVVAIAATAATS